jgi:P27 family predicted phage terminase small subunit
MGARGPSPKPTALKKLQGNPGKRALNQREPQPPAGHRTPNAPEWLTDAAKEIWIKNARSFWQLKLLTELDVMAFGAFCEWMALFLKAKKNVNAGMDVQVTGNGYRQQDPWVMIMNTSWTHAMRIMGHFGMTPSDRSRLKIEEAEKELSLAEQLFQMTKE